MSCYLAYSTENGAAHICCRSKHSDVWGEREREEKNKFSRWHPKSDSFLHGRSRDQCSNSTITTWAWHESHIFQFPLFAPSLDPSHSHSVCLSVFSSLWLLSLAKRGLKHRERPRERRKSHPVFPCPSLTLSSERTIPSWCPPRNCIYGAHNFFLRQSHKWRRILSLWPFS